MRAIKRFKSLSLPSAETLVMTAVQHRLQDPPTLSMVNDVLQTVELKVCPIYQNELSQATNIVLARHGEPHFANRSSASQIRGIQSED